MNIDIIVPTLDFGYRYMKDLFDALNREGLHPKVYSTSHISDEDYLGPRIKHLRFKLPIKSNYYDATLVLASPTLIWRIYQDRPEFVLVVEYSVATLWSILGARSAGAKIVIFQEHVAQNSKPKRVWKALLRGLADYTIANTSAAFDSLKDGRNAHKVQEIALLVPPLAKSPTGGVTLPEIPDDHTKFLFVGVLDERKNVSTLLDAVRTLSLRSGDFHLLIVGTGPLENSLAQQSSDLGVSQWVTFAGSVAYEMMSHYYRWCDVFIMPTLQDYRSVAVLEAMRYRKAIIDSRADGNAGDSVVEGRNGILVQPTDYRSIARAMYELASNPDRVAKMGNESAAYMDCRTPGMAAANLKKLLKS